MIGLTRPRSVAFMLLVVAAAALSACDFGKTSPTAPDQTAVAYSQTDLTVGTGTEASAGKTVVVQYGLWLYSDTTADHKGTSLEQNQFQFVVGSNQVIKGFDQGVAGMKVGGTRRLIVPPSLAYGSTGSNTIPPNAALVFDVMLVSVAG
jgi:FKBP-type peptidyl-prolyl cis-trans isomerase